MSRLNALVIGNSDYEFSNNLPNPANDAEDISEVLIKGGFTVNKLINATLREMTMVAKYPFSSLQDMALKLMVKTTLLQKTP